MNLHQYQYLMDLVQADHPVLPCISLEQPKYASAIVVIANKENNVFFMSYIFNYLPVNFCIFYFAHNLHE
jgi:hypothetical protein